MWKYQESSEELSRLKAENAKLQHALEVLLSTESEELLRFDHPAWESAQSLLNDIGGVK